MILYHDDVIKWKYFPRYWPFVRRIQQSKVNSPHKGQWREPLMFSLIWVWINDWVNNREAGELRRYRTHYDVTVLQFLGGWLWSRLWLLYATTITIAIYLLFVFPTLRCAHHMNTQHIPLHVKYSIIMGIVHGKHWCEASLINMRYFTIG